MNKEDEEIERWKNEHEVTKCPPGAAVGVDSSDKSEFIGLLPPMNLSKELGYRKRPFAKDKNGKLIWKKLDEVKLLRLRQEEEIARGKKW